MPCSGVYVVVVVVAFFCVADKITEEIHLFSLRLFHLAHTQQKTTHEIKTHNNAMKKERKKKLYTQQEKQRATREKSPNETK